jgi:hypothetical protein
LLIFLSQTGIPFLFSQTKIITGTALVRGHNEGLVSGATVLVKDTSTGAAKDLNGNYFLSVPEKADILIYRDKNKRGSDFRTSCNRY